MESNPGDENAPLPTQPEYDAHCAAVVKHAAIVSVGMACHPGLSWQDRADALSLATRLWQAVRPLHESEGADLSAAWRQIERVLEDEAAKRVLGLAAAAELRDALDRARHLISLT